MHLHGEAGVNRRGLKGEQESEKDADDGRGGIGVARYQSEGGKRWGKRERERKHHVLWEREWLSLLSPGLSRRFSSKRAINDAYTPWPHHHDHRGGVWWSPVVAMRRRRSSRWCSQEPNGFSDFLSSVFPRRSYSFVSRIFRVQQDRWIHSIMRGARWCVGLRAPRRIDSDRARGSGITEWEEDGNWRCIYGLCLNVRGKRSRDTIYLDVFDAGRLICEKVSTVIST